MPEYINVVRPCLVRYADQCPICKVWHVDDKENPVPHICKLKKLTEEKQPQ